MPPAATRTDADGLTGGQTATDLDSLKPNAQSKPRADAANGTDRSERNGLISNEARAKLREMNSGGNSPAKKDQPGPAGERRTDGARVTTDEADAGAGSADPTRSDADHSEARDTRIESARARAVLSRDGFPASIIDRMLSDMPAKELRTLVEKKQRAQQAASRLADENRKLQQQRSGTDEGASQRPNRQQAGNDQGTRRTTAERDPAGKAARIIETLRDEGFDDLAEEIGELLPDRTADTRDRPQSGRDESRRQSPAQLAATLQEPLDRIEPLYPSLKTVKERVDLVRTADRLADAGVFDDLLTDDSLSASELQSAMLMRAASIHFGGDTHPIRGQQRLLDQRGQMERHGQPSAEDDRAGAAKGPMSTRELFRHGLRALGSGARPAAVNAELQRLSASRR